MSDSRIILSILILTLESRKMFLERLKGVLAPQLTGKVELVVISDDGLKTIGAKRTEALHKAKGEYVCFVDDDDMVSSDYVSKILTALENRPDCVGMHLLHFNDGVLAGFTYHSMDYASWFETKDTSIGMMRYYRNPNHLNPVKREFAIKAGFPNTSWGEDREYSKNLKDLLRTEVYIKEPIYYYLYRSKK